MKAKQFAFYAISTLVLGVTVMVYIMASHIGIIFHRGLLSLFTVLIAELEICACVRYFVFEQMSSPSEAKSRRTELICGCVLLASMLVQILGNTLSNNGTVLQWGTFYYIGGYILFEPLQGGILLLLGIRGFVNAKRKHEDNAEVTVSIACRIRNAIVSAVFIIASVPYVHVTPRLFIISLLWTL